MKLKDMTIEEKKQLALSMGVSYEMVYRWANGHDNMSVSKAEQIERETGGRVKRYEAAFPKIDFNW